MSWLGFVASGKRNISSGREYDRYFNLNGVEGDEVVLVEDGDVNETINKMKLIVRKTLSQTQRIAPQLKGSGRLDTARKIWNFVYHHIQYKKDNPMREQIRQPLRTWRDRSSGVDCDCYSVFISSILSNLSMPHSFRIAAYEGEYQHVYIIIPKDGNDYSNYITVDCVADRFNYEVPYSKKKDFVVMGSNSLNGLGNACRKDQPLVNYVNAEVLSKRGFVFTSDVLKELGLPFSETINPNGNVPEVHFMVGGKSQVMPTAIKRDRVPAFKSNIQSLAKGTNGLAGFSNKNILWWGVGLGLGALLFMTSSDEEKPKAVAGLNGSKKAKRLSEIQI